MSFVAESRGGFYLGDSDDGKAIRREDGMGRLGIVGE